MRKEVIKKYLDNPFRLVMKFSQSPIMRRMDDRTYLKFIYRGLTGNTLHLDPPVTLNEKLQWLKLYDRRPEYATMVDKHLVKDYVANIIGQEHIVKTLGVWDSFDQIDFDALPEQFVLKCTHDSGGLAICKDKAHFDKEKARKKIEACMAQEYFFRAREWPYKFVEKKIIAEEYLSDGENADLPDYKIHCFGGEPKLILVCRDRYSRMTEDFFSEKWEHLPMKRPNHPAASQPIPAPECLEEMLELARVLAKDIPFVRVDFYQVGNRVYFGELTFYPTSGFGQFEPDDWDARLGAWLLLPEKKTE